MQENLVPRGLPTGRGGKQSSGAVRRGGPGGGGRASIGAGRSPRSYILPDRSIASPPPKAAGEDPNLGYLQADRSRGDLVEEHRGGREIGGLRRREDRPEHELVRGGRDPRRHQGR